MPAFFRLISEYFWLVALAFGAFNYRRARGTQMAAASGDQASESEVYLKRFALGANLPWVIMGLGQISGYTPMVWYYFRPQDGNPFVIAWLAVVLIMTCAYSWWVLFAGGAQKVRDLNLMAALGNRSSRPQSLLTIKLFAAFGPLFFPVWVYLVVHVNAPLPK
jgi:hypothetical protein